MEKLEGISMDIIQDNINKLKEIFPEIFTEGKIDFEILKQLLGEKIENDKERYSFTWKGKTEARQIAQDVSTGTLRPSKEDSKDWNNTENLYIEGDNLEVLKLLQKSYHGKIKMIYIDPPYNTGKDFVYKDNFKDNLKNYLEVTGQIGEDGQRLSTNSDSSGRYHSDWLNMMYPRLKLARNLLTDDGVIFISIDDNEQENLKKLCNEIFGEENFIANNVIITGANQSGDGVIFQKNIEYCVCYGKNIIKAKVNRVDKTEESYRNLNDAPTPLETRLDMGYTLYYNPKTEEVMPKIDYNKELVKKYNEIDKVYKNDEELISKGFIPVRPEIRNGKLHRWRWGIDTFIERKEEVVFFKGKNGFIPKFKQSGFNAPKNIHNFSGGTIELKKIFEEKTIFDYSKGINFLKYFSSIGMNTDSIILDFFSGSATTAHAVMELNAEDGGNRKYIMVQLPETCDEKSEAYKAGYKNICEIGKERIRRAGEKIKEELEKENSQLKLGEELKKLPDIGFKVFKLDSSNIKEWDSETEDLKQSLFDSVDNIKSDRASLDVLYEIILKYGLELTVPIEEKENFYSIGGGTLLINLDKEIDMEIIDSICKEYQNLLEIDEDFKTTVIFRDSSFKNDIDKTNALKKLEQVGIKEVRSI